MKYKIGCFLALVTILLCSCQKTNLSSFSSGNSSVSTTTTTSSSSIPVISHQSSESTLSSKESSSLSEESFSESSSEEKEPYLIYEYTIVDENNATISKIDTNETEIQLPDTTDDGIAITSIGTEACRGNTTIEKLTFSDSIVSIGESCFQDCTSLREVTFGSSFSFMNGWCFANCENLETIALPKKLSKVTGDNFYGCDKLENIEALDCETALSNGIVAYSYVSEEEHALRYSQSDYWGITVGTKNTIISSWATSLDAYSFGGRDYVRNLSQFCDADTLVWFKLNSFYGCENITSLHIQNYMYLYPGAFNGCPNITFISCQGSHYYSDLNSNGVFGVLESTFDVVLSYKFLRGCAATVLNDKVERIESYAFDSVSGLTSITIPSSLLYMGSNVFDHCDDLTDIYVTESSMEHWDEDWLGDCQATIHKS